MARNAHTVAFTTTTFDASKAQFSHEGKDCAVRALMTATGATYAEAHKTLRERCDRRDGCGTYFAKIRNMMATGQVLGCTTRRVLDAKHEWNGRRWAWVGRKSIKAFARANPTGRFFCNMNEHCFAIVDGAIVDTWRVPAGSLIFDAWEIVPAAKAAPVRGAQALVAQYMAHGEAVHASTVAADLGITAKQARAALQALTKAGVLVRTARATYALA